MYAANVEPRNGIVDNLSIRREQIRTRRSRLRYRRALFNNTVSLKHKWWMVPSIENKIQTHLTVVANAYKILPISKFAVETASFDVQKIKTSVFP